MSLTAGLAVPAGAAAYTVQKPANAGSINGIGCYGAVCLAAANAGPSSTTGDATVISIAHGQGGSVESVPDASFLYDAACGSPTYCMAVGSDQNISSSPWNGSTGEGNGSAVGIGVPVENGEPGSLITLPAMIDLTGVACPTTSICLVVGSEQPPGPNNGNCCGAVIAITNGQAGPAQVVNGTAAINTITCATASSCFAVGQGYDGNSGIVPVTNGVAGAYSELPEATAYGGDADLLFIGCATASRCIGTAASDTTVISNGRAGPWIPAPEESDTFGPISCESATACMTIDDLGGQDLYGLGVEGVVGSPSYLPLDHLNALACWSTTSCLVGGYDQIEYQGQPAQIAALVDLTPPSPTGGANGSHGSTGGASACVVPRVVGLKLSKARQALSRAHCSVGRITYRHRRGKHGKVVSQSPAPRSHRSRGTRVKLVVGR